MNNNRAFIGRKHELEQLNLLLQKRAASLIVIKGRRRIGKSRLIFEFAKNHKFYPFAGLAPDKPITDIQQKQEFARKLAELFGLPGLRADDWGDLFTVLANQIKNQKAIILFDEISWMAHKDATFLAKLKNAWDMQFSQNPNLILILCGSVSSWIDQKIINNTGYFGRISKIISLKELPLNDCNKFWPKTGNKISNYEKFKSLAITGGVPKYLEEIIPNLPAEKNIKNLCFEPNGLLFNEYEQIFTKSFSKQSELYKDIIEILIKKNKNYDEICQTLGKKSSGYISDTLQELEVAGYIRKTFSWNITTGKKGSLYKYSICDNYLRFYLKYIDPFKDRIKNGAFSNISLNTLPNWYNIMGLQFENLVLTNTKTIKQLLDIKEADVIADNPFFQTKTTRQAGCQIDYAIQTRFDTFYLCEIKFSKHPIKISIVQEVQEKMARIKLPKRMSIRPILICVNGVEDNVLDCQFFSQIIDFGQLLNPIGI